MIIYDVHDSNKNGIQSEILERLDVQCHVLNALDILLDDSWQVVTRAIRFHSIYLVIFKIICVDTVVVVVVVVTVGEVYAS